MKCCSMHKIPSDIFGVSLNAILIHVLDHSYEDSSLSKIQVNVSFIFTAGRIAMQLMCKIDIV